MAAAAELALETAAAAELAVATLVLRLALWPPWALVLAG
jgi:hypothetical protein